MAGVDDPSPEAEDPLLDGPLRPNAAAWRARLYVVIFEADTPGGRAFDVALLAAIALSVVAVMLETVRSVGDAHGTLLRAAEWGFTGLFTVEYALRLLSVRSPRRYALSFFGLVDLLSILPTFVGLAVAGGQSLLIVRALRLLRIFRIFKLGRFVSEAAALRAALWESREKVVVFLATVVVVVSIIGTAMYLVEGELGGNAGFSSIPQSVYWAVVTMTTVGYGDVTPVTPLGKALSALLIILGYALIVVPTGIVSAGLSKPAGSGRPCPICGRGGHDADAGFCKHCGAGLGVEGGDL